MTETAGPGHNSGDPHAQAKADVLERVEAFLKGADVWAGRDELDEGLAARANDFLTGAKRLLKEAEEARRAEKRPHEDAAKAVDQEWAPIKSRIQKVCDIVSPLLDRFLRAKAAKEAAARAEAERQRKAAEEAARAAELDAANAASASARIEAEERAAAHQRTADAAARAERRAAEPPRAGSATGLANRRGLKTVRKARIASLALALAHYRNHPKVLELLEQLANAELRGAPIIAGVKQIPSIPGIVFEETQEIAA